jgi:hypothetical protein
MNNRSCGDISSNLLHDFIEKTTISAYFTRQEFVCIEALPETKQFNSPFCTETILQNFIQFVNLLRPKMQAQGYWLHIDNVKPHNSALSLHKNEELGFTALP